MQERKREKMARAPTLLSLCMDAIVEALVHGSYNCVEEAVELLPAELVDGLVSRLPPLALQSLHETFFGTSIGGVQGNRHGRKRRRCKNFNIEWQILFKVRWPLDDKNNKMINPFTSDGGTGEDKSVTVDWQQHYWEKHLQECLDEAAEMALLPSFHGNISELIVSDRIMNIICGSKDMSQQCSRLSYHCSRFGCYARCLRLQNVLCTAEVCGLLQPSKMEKLMFIRIISKSEVDGACMLISRHSKTLLSLEFVHCQLYPSVMDQICENICHQGSQIHGIQQFSIKSSRISESKLLTISAGLLNFLSSGKLLHFLSLHDTKMQPSFAKMIILALLESSCDLHTLDISENNLSGWLSSIDKKPTSFSSALESNVSLSSLTILNLRADNLHGGDAEDLCSILVKMPNLRSLDLSDNPITDDGIRLLIPYFARALQKEDPLSKIRVENCDLSSVGATELLECLTSVKKPLDVLSIADNHLGSFVATALAKFLGSHVRELNVEDIDLGALGFQILEEALPRETALYHINISKNRGGIKTAQFLSRLILQAPSLVSVNAGANLLPPESLDVICNALKQAKCNLERLDLTGNAHLSGAAFPAALEFKNNGGKSILVLPSKSVSPVPYDDDP